LAITGRREADRLDPAANEPDAAASA